MDTYTLNVAGLKRELPLCRLNEGTRIAGFVMFSDVELTIECAKALEKLFPDYDLILTAESKGIPLAYELSRRSGKNYIVARKKIKVYMTDPISADVQSITTKGMQRLYLSQEDVQMMQGRRILIVDDVISTGESLRALEALTERAGGIIAAKAAVLAEGDACKRDDIIYLEELPLFFDKQAD